jgi:protein O-GlcNAc transferase
MAAATQQWILQGLNHAQAGRLAQAEQCYRQVLAFDPNPTTRILLAGLLPPIYLSNDELQQWRAKLTSNLQALHRDGLALDVTTQYAVPEFFVTYQGMNDRELQKMRASLYRAPAEILFPSHRPKGKIRVGFISGHFREHTIGRLNLGLVSRLDPEQFHVTVIATNPPRGELAEQFRERADTYLDIPADGNYARRIIAGLKLDVLFYTDLGMEPVTYTLALTRMAPVQCVTWGHPVTSGIDTIDYFISAEALEPEEAQDHYTEKLVRLKHLAVYYERPKRPASPTPRSAFGLADDATLYGCLQSLYKFHPDFDALLAGVLRGDPKGLLVLLKGNHADWEQRLMQRFSQSMPDVTDRIRWVGRQDRDGFLSLTSLLDVSLDPIHFGGGNTSYEALAFGVPIVTMPSGFLRGRLTYAMYRQMNLDDCIAESTGDYVQRALRLGTDKAHRQHVSGKILGAGDRIFENPDGVRDLEAFFRTAVSEHRAFAVERAV